MAEPLRQLINSAAFLVLHENLEKWLKLYHKNTCDENIATGCELIELNARLQGQLFRLISICATEGGLYGGANAIKSRLLPLLGGGLYSPGLTSSTSMSALNSSCARATELEELKRAYTKSLERLESDIGMTYKENSRLRSDFENTREDAGRRTNGAKQDRYAKEQHLHDLRSKVQSLEDENERLQSRLMHDSMAERGSRKQRNGSNNATVKPMTESDLFDEASEPITPQHHVPDISPLSPLDPVQRSRQQNLIARFNDLFSGSRVEAMSILRRYLDDHDMNQTIVFQVVLEAFAVARSHFRAYRNRVRAKLASSTNPPTSETLDELTQSHMNVHASYAIDLSAMAHEVLLAMERHVPRIRRPSSALGFEVISEFIQEMCKFAWECSILAHPIDVYRPVCVNEVIDENKYRRSHDSSYSVVLVHHHIWPCLIMDGQVVSKGEACTKRGRSVVPMRTTSPESKKRTSKSRTNAPNARSCSPERRSTSPSGFRNTSAQMNQTGYKFH